MGKNTFIEFFNRLPLFEASILLAIVSFFLLSLFVGSFSMVISDVSHNDDGIIEHDKSGDIATFSSLSEAEQKHVSEAIEKVNESDNSSVSLDDPITVEGSAWTDDTDMAVMDTTHTNRKLTVIDDQNIYNITYGVPHIYKIMLFIGVIVNSLILVAGILQRNKVDRKYVSYRETVGEVIIFGIAISLLFQIVLVLIILDFGQYFFHLLS